MHRIVIKKYFMLLIASIFVSWLSLTTEIAPVVGALFLAPYINILENLRFLDKPNILKSTIIVFIDFMLYYFILFGMNLIYCKIDLLISNQRIIQHIQSSFHKYACEIPVIFYKLKLGGWVYAIIIIGYIIQRSLWSKTMNNLEIFEKNKFVDIQKARLNYYTSNVVVVFLVIIIIYFIATFFF